MPSSDPKPNPPIQPGGNPSPYPVPATPVPCTVLPVSVENNAMPIGSHDPLNDRPVRKDL